MYGPESIRYAIALACVAFSYPVRILTAIVVSPLVFYQVPSPFHQIEFQVI